jgi:nucleotide-binding universal stress UspA family protein
MSGRIVVGIDGSEPAAEALRWAVAQAKLTGATVEAVYAWDPGALVTLGVPPLVDWDLLREVAESRPGEIVLETIGSEPGVRIVPKTVMGNAAEALVGRSAKADLLVVGSRGLGGLKGMLLGSVGHHCAAHSHCPVVIVHRAPLPQKRAPRRDALEKKTGRPVS